MSEDMGYSEGAKKETPHLEDAETRNLKDGAIKKIEQKQALEQEKINMGIKEPVKEIESIPKEVPALFFKFGSKVLKCEKFRTDDEENKILAKHLSNIIGAQNSKIYSVIVIIVVIISKIIDCMDAVNRLFHKTTAEESEKLKEQGRPQAKIFGDGT